MFFLLKKNITKVQFISKIFAIFYNKKFSKISLAGISYKTGQQEKNCKEEYFTKILATLIVVLSSSNLIRIHLSQEISLD